MGFQLQNLLGKYLDEEDTAKDFMRIKGVFNIAGNDQVFVIQCVHMLKSQSFMRMWGDNETRENRIIFIGRGIQQRREELTAEFMACIAKPLRLPVGTKVLA